MIHIKESQIIEQLIRGDEKALEYLMSVYRHQVTLFLKRSLPREEDVESLVQEVFLKIWMNRENLDVNRSFDSYLFTVAKNILINHLRRLVYKRRYVQDSLGQSDQYEQTASGQLEYDELKKKVEYYISLMPAKRREIFAMNRFDGKKYKEIALEMGISENTVNAQMHKAMVFLKEKLKEYQFLLFLW